VRGTSAGYVAHANAGNSKASTDRMSKDLLNCIYPPAGNCKFYSITDITQGAFKSIKINFT
jgi:hypothetical protein